MAYRIIYTSAPRLLQAGRSGFGVVARHREVPQDVAEFAEMISQFSRAAGFPADRVVCAYRVFKAPSGSWHILSRISDAGASFTARTNHLAEHLVIEEAEMQKVVSAGGTPAGVMLAYSWPSFAGDSRWLSPGEAWEASALRASPYGDKWAELCPDSDPKRRRLLSCGPGVTTSIFFEYPDRLRTPAGAKEILQLFAESESDCPKRGWGCAFTTDLQPSDNQADFQWIGLPSSSPLAASLKASGRKVVDFRSPVPHSSATKPSAAAGKISPAPSTGAKVKSPSQTPRNRATRSSWPMWLTVLLGCLLFLGLIACVYLGLELQKIVSSSKDQASAVLPNSGEAPTTKTSAARDSLPAPKEATLPSKRFDQTFLVPLVIGERPDQKGSADEATQSFLANSVPLAKRIEYRNWQSGGSDWQSLPPDIKPVNYGNFFDSRDKGALDLQFGSTNNAGTRPLRIVELVAHDELGDDQLPFAKLAFVVDSRDESEIVSILRAEGEDQSELPGLRPGSNGQIVLHADETLRAKFVGESAVEDIAVLTAPEGKQSLPKLRVKNPQWMRERRMALQDEAAGKFPPYNSNLEGVVGFLKGSQSRGNNFSEVISDLLGYFGAEPAVDKNKPPENKAEQNAAAKGETNVQSNVSQQVDHVAIVIDAAAKLLNSSKPGAKETGEILRQIAETLDASKPKQGILEEFEKRLRQEEEEQLTKQKTLQQQAQKKFSELFGNGSSLLPAGDYVLGLSHKGKDDKAPTFYPAIKVRISFDRKVKDQKGYLEGQKSLIRAEQTPQTQ